MNSKDSSINLFTLYTTNKIIIRNNYNNKCIWFLFQLWKLVCLRKYSWWKKKLFDRSHRIHITFYLKKHIHILLLCDTLINKERLGLFLSWSRRKGQTWQQSHKNLQNFLERKTTWVISNKWRNNDDRIVIRTSFIMKGNKVDHHTYTARLTIP